MLELGTLKVEIFLSLQGLMHCVRWDLGVVVATFSALQGKPLSEFGVQSELSSLLLNHLFRPSLNLALAFPFLLPNC